MMGRRTMQQQKNKHLFDWPADRRTVPLSPTSQQGVRTWLSRLLRRRLLQRLVSLLLVAILVSYFALYDLPKWRGTLTILGVQSTPPSTAYEAVNEAITTDLSNGHLPDFSLPSALPQIPAKIWQIYLAYAPDAVKPSTIKSFTTLSPSHTYTILDNPGANALIDHVAANYPNYTHIRTLYDAMSRTVVRADFLRFLVLAVAGGLYSDTDTTMLRPLSAWVPAGLDASRVRLIVGIEADARSDDALVGGTTYRVQLCQWTLAGARGHPAFWAMVDRVLAHMAGRMERKVQGGFSNWEVLDMGGPAGWSEVVYAHLSRQVGREVGWRDLTGLEAPVLFGDTLVLPVDGFATGVPHSGATFPQENYTEAAMVLHHFESGWKTGG